MTCWQSAGIGCELNDSPDLGDGLEQPIFGTLLHYLQRLPSIKCTVRPKLWLAVRMNFLNLPSQRSACSIAARQTFSEFCSAHLFQADSQGWEFDEG